MRRQLKMGTGCCCPDTKSYARMFPNSDASVNNNAGENGFKKKLLFGRCALAHELVIHIHLEVVGMVPLMLELLQHDLEHIAA